MEQERLLVNHLIEVLISLPDITDLPSILNKVNKDIRQFPTIKIREIKLLS
jgi:hypothetical protein